MNLNRHRAWLGLLATAALLAFVAAPLLHAAEETASRKLAGLQSERADAERTVGQWQNASSAQRVNGRLTSAEVEQILAPVSRLHVAKILERAAAENQLSHFSYTLSPEQKTVITTDGGQQTLMLSMITLEADLPLDRDAYRFADSLPSLLPGKTSLQQLALERTAKNGAFDLANLHMTASFAWLSNGALKDMAGVP